MFSQLIPGVGMILVGAIALAYWRHATRLEFRWFAAGLALWGCAVAAKVAIAAVINEPIMTSLKAGLPHSAFVLAGGLLTGIEGSATEMGVTLLAVLIWRRLGADSARAIGIGLGAGAFEAMILGAVSLGTIVAAHSGVAALQPELDGLEKMMANTPYFFLVGPVERAIAILCHAATRALIILGVVHGRYLPVFLGFLVFALLDGVGGVIHLTGIGTRISLWWTELALLPLALVSIPILKWCHALRGAVAQKGAKGSGLEN